MRERPFLLTLALVSSCGVPLVREAEPPPHREPPSLVEKLKARGISDLTTRKIVVRDSEAGYGPDVRVVATEAEEFIIQEVWDCIYLARPYHRWAASGFREVEFYDREDSDQPLAVLCVNETGRAHFKGDPADSGFRCPGLAPYVEGLLKHEYLKGREVVDGPP